MSPQSSLEWICTQRHCRHGPAFAPVAAIARAPIPRLCRETWLRYRLPLTQPGPAPLDATLTPIDAPLMELLRRHPEHDQHQVRSAFRFWQTGFGDGYLWLDAGEPLCMIWLLTQRHLAARAGLGTWAGMYAPLPEGAGIAEGIYTFRRGLRRPGGAATAMAHALFYRARNSGLTELRTHIHGANLGAQRWAARVGWQPIGFIHRCFFDLPRLRDHPFYLHELGVTARAPEDRQPPATRAPQPAVIGKGRENDQESAFPPGT